MEQLVDKAAEFLANKVPELLTLCLLVRWFLAHLKEDRIARTESEERQDKMYVAVADKCGVALAANSKALGSHKEVMSRIHNTADKLDRHQCVRETRPGTGTEPSISAVTT